MFNWIVDYLEKTILWYSHPLCMIVCKSSQSSYIILPRTGSHLHGIVFLVSMSNSAKHLSDARIALEIVSTPLFIPLCEISIVFFGWANCVQTLVCTTIFTLWKPIYLFGTQQWTFSTPPLKTYTYIYEYWVFGKFLSFLPTYCSSFNEQLECEFISLKILMLPSSLIPINSIANWIQKTKMELEMESALTFNSIGCCGLFRLAC